MEGKIYKTIENIILPIVSCTLSITARPHLTFEGGSFKIFRVFCF